MVALSLRALGLIGEGSMRFIIAKTLHGMRVTDNNLVDYMLKRIAYLGDNPMVSNADDGLHFVTS